MDLVLLLLFFVFTMSAIFYLARKVRKEAANSLEMKEQLKQSKEKYKKLFKHNKAVELIIDASTKQIVDANDSALKFYGYTFSEITALKISDINILSEEEISDEIKRAQIEERKMFNFKHRLSSGAVKDVEVYSGPLEINGKEFLYSIVFDITNRTILEEIVELRNKLLELVYIGDGDKLLQYALDKAESLTNSKIGFFHFVENDQENISLQVWSTNTLEKMCFAEGLNTHYPISKAGVWVDCIHQRQPVIHNDYESLPHKKGLPEGHAKLVRELTVPVFKDDLIVAVIGVGNKEQDYDSNDIKIVKQIAEMAYDYSERLKAEQKIEFMAYYDILTSLPNRALLTDRMKQAIAMHRRTNQFLAVCFIDLDGFKPVNDEYGHHIGDKLLIILAKRLQEHLRDGDTLARIGGDEFVLVITGLTKSDEYKEVVERVLHTINIPFEIEDYRIHISSSIGVTVFPIDNKDTDELLRHADQAMYQAKEEGKSKYKLYQHIRDEEAKLNEKLLQEFSVALKQNQLVLHYQPKIDLTNGSIIGFESLVRWMHPKNGLMFPDKFLPLIENTSMEIELDEWVIKKALAQKVEFDKLGLSLSISVNVNPRYLQMQSFVTFISSALSPYSKEFAKGVEIEVLEVASIENTKLTSKIINDCKEFGIKFSLDDFGTGYASLSHLHELPIDILKIDQEFVKNMLESKNDLDIVEGVLKLADALNKPVIAEGVESIEIGLMLLSLGCKYAQGYAIARPMPPEDVIKWIEHWKNNSIWYKLQGETSSDMGVYDIHVAIFSHKKWVNDVVEYVKNYPNNKTEPTREHECEFGHWYKGVGRSKYGDKESYAFIQAEHNYAHKIAEQMIQLVQIDKKEEALKLENELQNHALGLISLLNKLAKQ